MKGEEKINLKDIKIEGKKPWTALDDITEKEYKEYWEKLDETDSAFSFEKIFSDITLDVTKEMDRTLRETSTRAEAIVALWKERGRNSITIEEFILTANFFAIVEKFNESQSINRTASLEDLTHWINEPN